MCIALIHNIPTCKDLLARIKREAMDAMNKQLSCVEDKSKL